MPILPLNPTPCQRGVPASPKNPNTITALAAGYQLFAAAEAKSPRTIENVTSSLAHFERFLLAHGLPNYVTEIDHHHIQAFILYLRQKKRFSTHPFTSPQPGVLSPYTVSCYLRAIRSFWSWLSAEGIIEENPFLRIKMPRVPRKVVPTFSPAQLQALLGVIDTAQGEGFRDLAIILTFYDTGLRVSELTGLKVDDVDLEDGSLKVMGKGGKERIVPFGKGVSRFLWHYITRIRPEPLWGRDNRLFLTADGRPMRRALVQTRIAKYGRCAGLSGVRCSPHTLRHSAAVNFLRNGGNVFSLQRLLGHSTLEMTRHYCELADVDVKKAHLVASPVDNMMAGGGAGTVSHLRTAKRR